MEKAIENNDFFEFKKCLQESELELEIEFESELEFDPLETLLKLPRFNNSTLRILDLLLETFEFPKSSEYLILLLTSEKFGTTELRMFESLIENTEFEADSEVVSLVKERMVFDKLLERLRDSNQINTQLLNVLGKMNTVSSQICGFPLGGDVIILETDKGLINGTRDSLNIENYYKQDIEYSLLNDGDMNTNKPIYKLEFINVGSIPKTFYVNEHNKNILMDDTIVTYSGYLDVNVLIVRNGEVPSSVDLHTFIPRDKCEIYI